jgi:hypothetical protein
MLSASVRIIGHPPQPATAPPSWRSVKVALSLSTRDAISCVVVIHTLRRSGCVNERPPLATAEPAAGSRK